MNKMNPSHDEDSLWDSVFSTSHVFLLGVAIGSFLTYHYLCKSSNSSSSSTLKSSSSSGRCSLGEAVQYDTPPGIRLLTESSNAAAAGGWRDSNPELLATPNPEQHNRRRRSSLLYR